jgi:hypothetical protein
MVGASAHARNAGLLHPAQCPMLFLVFIVILAQRAFFMVMPSQARLFFNRESSPIQANNAKP